MTAITKRDKSKKRATILEGAIDVFIDLGYELASMDKIAERAGVSKKTVYNHFGNKENLFQVIVDDLLAQRQALKTLTYDPSKSLEDQLRLFAQAEIFLMDSPRRLGLSRFLTITFLKDIDYARETVSKYPPAYGMFLEWLKAAQKDGRIQSDNLLLSARLFYALVEGAITWPALFTEDVHHLHYESLLDEIIFTFMARYGSK